MNGPATAADSGRVVPEKPLAPVQLGSALTFAYFATYLALLPTLNVTLALRVQEVTPDDKAAVLSLVLAAGAITAFLSHNLAGLVGDRTTSRWGRRRPWLVVGAVAGAVAGVLLGSAGSTTELVAGWTLTQLSYNVVLAALNPLLAERVPTESRGAVAGVLGLTAPVAVMVGTFLVATLPSTRAALLLPAAVAVLANALLAVVLAEPALSRHQRPHTDWRAVLAAYWVDPRRHPDYAWAWASRAFVFVGVGTLLGYQAYYLQDRLGVPADELADVMFEVVLVSTVCTALTAPLFGAVSDRLGRRKLFVVAAAVLLAATHAGALLAPDVPTYLAVAAIKGLAMGCYLAVDLALMVEVTPDRKQSGRWMAVFNLANVAPQVVVPLLAPLLLATGAPDADNYPALLGVAAAAGLLGALLILPIRRVR